jgi:hypothetical protein
MASGIAILVRCAHGSGIVAASAHRVTIGGVGLLTEIDSIVTGCAAPPAERCVRVQWLNSGDRVRIGAQVVVFAATAGLCFTAAGMPTGAPTITGSARVIG